MFYTGKRKRESETNKQTTTTKTNKKQKQTNSNNKNKQRRAWINTVIFPSSALAWEIYKMHFTCIHKKYPQATEASTHK